MIRLVTRDAREKQEESAWGENINHDVIYPLSETNLQKRLR